MESNSVHTPPLRETGVAEIMSRHVVAVRSDCDLMVAVDTFLRTALRHLAVVDEHGACLGMLSSEQTLAALATTGRRPRQVADHLPPGRPRLHQGASVRRAAQVMSLELVDALPVVDDADRVVGVITWSDIVALVADPDRRS